MSVVHFGPRLKRARSDDDNNYVGIPPRPPPPPLQKINDLYNLRGYDDAAVTLKRHVEGTLRGEDRVKLRLTEFQGARSDWTQASAEGDVLASTLSSYPVGMHVAFVSHADGTSSLGSMLSDAPQESFTRLKFKGKKVRERDAYLGHESLMVVRIP
jgi:hypothetical protein